MSTELINRSPDLKRLQDDGYELFVVGATAMVSHVPYLDSQGFLKYGVLASPLRLSGDIAVYDNNHVIKFSGDYPYYDDGSKITAIQYTTTDETIGGIKFSYMFSNRPQDGYRDTYEKFARYIHIISAPARVKYPTETARTYRKIGSEIDTVFQYQDSNSARAGITEISDKMRGQKLAIIGLGGTGSYVLDYVAKTPVQEIHLIDGDKLMQHNAFRAPGAPSVDELMFADTKVEYYARRYGNMHRNIYPHSFMLTKTTVQVLAGIDFAFVCVDSDDARTSILKLLGDYNIPYVDTGMGLSIMNGGIRGTVRCTAEFQPQKLPEATEILHQQLEDDPYSTNIQIAELNALNAAFAVIKWKKKFGFYLDQVVRAKDIYSVDCGGMVHESESV
ncbi:MAG: ThiF family adenylyltransferase [Agathobacter sp.]